MDVEPHAASLQYRLSKKLMDLEHLLRSLSEQQELATGPSAADLPSRQMPASSPDRAVRGLQAWSTLALCQVSLKDIRGLLTKGLGERDVQHASLHDEVLSLRERSVVVFESKLRSGLLFGGV
jgi:hypothetical protein